MFLVLFFIFSVPVISHPSAYCAFEFNYIPLVPICRVFSRTDEVFCVRCHSPFRRRRSSLQILIILLVFWIIFDIIILDSEAFALVNTFLASCSHPSTSEHSSTWLYNICWMYWYRLQIKREMIQKKSPSLPHRASYMVMFHVMCSTFLYHVQPKEPISTTVSV
jgi:hypothetical protein